MLDEMTDAALRVLSRNRRGFFLMVEGAHIDKQAHLMDAERAVGEVVEFDRAVGVARDWADRLGDTVVIVVADHECSGFSIVGALQGGIARLASLPSDAGNLAPDPTFASQPARLKSVGTYDAAAFPRYDILADGYPASYDVDGKILFGFGANGDRYETWLTRPLTVVDSLLPSVIKTELAGKGYSATPLGRLSDQSGYFVRGQAPGDQAVHTASDIPISAYSTGTRAWRLFTGVQTNTDVFFKLARAVLSGDED
jgi:alkaline phosphatase